MYMGIDNEQSYKLFMIHCLQVTNYIYGDDAKLWGYVKFKLDGICIL
jgi:hypothetical protein